MCEGCPYLNERLGKGSDIPSFSEKENVCCVECGTSLAEVLETSEVGCSSCYQVFQDSIRSLFQSKPFINEEKARLLTANPAHPLHGGRKPAEEVEASISSRIVELNNALSLAIRDENYEQAASIRDEINNLMNSNE